MKKFEFIWWDANGSMFNAGDRRIHTYDHLSLESVLRSADRHQNEFNAVHLMPVFAVYTPSIDFAYTIRRVE